MCVWKHAIKLTISYKATLVLFCYNLSIIITFPIIEIVKAAVLVLYTINSENW